ncbi:hypothetical protein WJX84_010776 [Apatococcus fuscideae]|uniref:F-box domain-containing protein n=1 Tax=Apatococcus fuscideae TaxID=2026836 RepID=A0AAW1SSN2_9CHLO
MRRHDRVQPYGNLLAKGGTSCRQPGLGSLGKLEDSLLLVVLGNLPAESLGRLATVSRSLYCFANHEDLWRHMTLQELEGNFRFTGSWRGSYIFSSLCQKGGHSQFLRHLCKHTNSKRARAEAPEELGQSSLPRADCASKLQAESSRLGPPVAKVTLKIHSSESSKQNFTPHFHTETAGQAGVATKFGRNKKRRAASVEAQQGYEAHLKVSNFYSDLLYQPWHCFDKRWFFIHKHVRLFENICQFHRRHRQTPKNCAAG